MKYVLDASVAVKMLLHEQDSRLALALREDFKGAIGRSLAFQVAEANHKIPDSMQSLDALMPDVIARLSTRCR